MKPIVSNLIPKSEGHNITADQIVDVVDNINFISFVANKSKLSILLKHHS